VDGPPLDPDDWTDEQWQAYLQATEDDEEGSEARSERDDRGRGAETFRRVVQSGFGTVMGAGMLGLEQALYGAKEKDEIVAVADDDDPDRDLSSFDPDDPASSVISLADEPPRAAGPPPAREPTHPPMPTDETEK
jgi:hypothetical protein